MVRPAAVALALILLPAFAHAQEMGAHTVVRGNTLWGIAQQYYGDPFQWPRIYEANRDRIDNPHRIVPGLVVRVPEAGAMPAAPVEPGPPGVVTLPQPVEPLTPFPAGPRPRTVFYREVSTEVVGVGSIGALWDVPPHQFYSAPWLIPPGTTPQRSGAIEGFEGADDIRSARNSARPFDRVQIRMEGPPPPAGTRLQAFRVERDVPDVGHVVRPTGILRVESVGPAGVVASVETHFGLVLLGDLVRSLPSYSPLPVDAPRSAVGGTEATVLGFATEREIQSPGAHLFLDAGAGEGVDIGDEYVIVWGDSPEWAGAVEGRVKVVAVLDHVSTARIVHLANPVFATGVRLRPDRRVR